MTLNDDYTYVRVDEAFKAFGYEPRKKGDHIVYQHPQGRMMAILPMMDGEAAVSPLHKSVIKNIIRDDAIVDPEDFLYYLEHGKRRNETIQRGDHLIWREPSSGLEKRVTAAASEEDGTVIIKQSQGAFSPCPVAQLRKEWQPRDLPSISG